MKRNPFPRIHSKNLKMRQDKLESMMKEFENTTYIAQGMSTSWLRDFMAFVDRNKHYEDVDIR